MSVTFYRKYRSQTFETMQGQGHIVQTLTNAIMHDRLSHAYIFSGPRGTGKTSAARILAKAINCRKGKSPTPCLECDLCQKITRGQSVDVVEIDAASNTGVDNIRTLNDQVNFIPVECLYKIYIIDEAHMLSTGAFNALLKTLEEPPSHTIFILATTESHKIPITIQSRCQHLHFRKLTTLEIVNQLKMITSEENISIDEAGLATIARNASGCMRDAISLLNQLYSFAGATISGEDINLMLGSSNFDKTDHLLTLFLEKKSSETLQALQQFFLDGAHLMQLASDVTLVLRQLLFIKLSLESQLDIDEARLNKLKTLAPKVEVNRLAFLLETMAKLEMELRWFPNPELLFEIRLLTLMHETHTQAPQTEQVAIKQATPQAAPVKAMSEAPKQVTQQPSTPTIQVQASVPVPKPPVPTPPATPIKTVASDPIVTPAQQPQGTKEKWTLFLNKIKAQKAPLFSILDRSDILGINDTYISIRLKQDFQFFRDKLNDSPNKVLIESVLKEVFEKPLALSFSKLESTQSATTFSTPGQDPPPAPIASGSGSKSGSQKINQIVAMFEGTIVHK